MILGKFFDSILGKFVVFNEDDKWTWRFMLSTTGFIFNSWLNTKRARFIKFSGRKNEKKRGASC